MRKLTLLLISLLVVFSMLLAACDGAATDAPDEPAPPDAPEPTDVPIPTAVPTDEPAVLNVWSFTNEIRTMAIAFEGRYPNVDVNYTIIPMTAGEYQTKLKATLGTSAVPSVAFSFVWYSPAVMGMMV